MARLLRSLLPCWALPPPLLLLLVGYLPATSPAPSRLRLLWPRVPLDGPRYPWGWLTTEVPFCDAPKSWLAGQLEGPRAPTRRLTGSRCGLASRTGLRRRKRRAAARPRQAPRLMRVGCVLGTCQVQTLGHRLWQLQGRLRGQGSSPMNPSSPHSYG